MKTWLPDYLCKKAFSNLICHIYTYQSVTHQLHIATLYATVKRINQLVTHQLHIATLCAIVTHSSLQLNICGITMTYFSWYSYDIFLCHMWFECQKSLSLGSAKCNQLFMPLFNLMEANWDLAWSKRCQDFLAVKSDHFFYLFA